MSVSDQMYLGLLKCTDYLYSFLLRIHPGHHDDGGVGAARRHDGHPRGRAPAAGWLECTDPE